MREMVLQPGITIRDTFAGTSLTKYHYASNLSSQDIVGLVAKHRAMTEHHAAKHAYYMRLLSDLEALEGATE